MHFASFRTIMYITFLFFPPERIKFSGGLCMRGLKFSRLEEMIIMCSQFEGRVTS